MATASYLTANLHRREVNASFAHNDVHAILPGHEHMTVDFIQSGDLLKAARYAYPVIAAPIRIRTQ